jgi:hypothetical protein
MMQEEMEAIVAMLDVRVAVLKAELIEFFSARSGAKVAPAKLDDLLKTDETAPMVKRKAGLGKNPNLNHRHSGDGKLN